MAITKIKAGKVEVKVEDAAGVLWICLSDLEEPHDVSGYMTPAEVTHLHNRLTLWLRENPATPEDTARFVERQRNA